MGKSIKKVLFVCPGYSIYMTPIIKALRETGMEVEFFNNRPELIYRNRFVKALLRQPLFGPTLKRNAVSAINKKLLDAVNTSKPDMLFVSTGDNISPQTISHITAQGVVTVNWYLEFMNHWHIIEKVASSYSLFFSPDPYILKKLQASGLHNCHYLPFAGDTILPGDPFDNREDEFTISFIGNYDATEWQDRERFFAHVARFGLHIWGPAAWKQTSLAPYYHGPATAHELAQIYRSSTFVIDIPWRHLPAEGVSVRPFETLVNGACLLFYAIRSDMECIFEEGKEYVAFSNEQELVTKITYLLEHEDQRKKIARVGYEKVMRLHTYPARIREILAIATERSND